MVTFSVVPGVSRSLLVAAGVDLAAGVFWLLRGVEGDTDLELRGEERSACTSLDLSGCKTGGEWEVRAPGWLELTVV